LRGDPAPLLDVGVEIAGPVQDEGRDPHGGQHVPHVDLRVHSEQRQGRSRAGAAAEERRDPSAERRVRARRVLGNVHLPMPLTLDGLEVLLPLLGGGRPGVVGAPDPLGEDSEGDEGNRPFRVGRGEEDAHVPALGRSEDRGPLGSDRVHHGPDVVHPLLDRRQLVVRHAVRHPGAAPVEENQS
jgi:hypothetical protein